MTSSSAPRKRTPSCLQCGHRRLHRHGDRRWKCPACGITYRPRKRKVGRKKRRSVNETHARSYLAGHRSIRSRAALLHQSYGATHDQLDRSIATISHAACTAPFLWRDGEEIILVADAVWLSMNGIPTTIYIVLLRHCEGSEHASVVLVHPQIGRECEEHWRYVIGLLPLHLREHIVGATIDGHRGLFNAIAALCGDAVQPPLVQRCQFHVLAELRHRIGWRRIQCHRTTHHLWTLARQLLQSHDLSTLHRRTRELVVNLSTSTDLPKETQEALSWFFHTLPHTTVYLREPHPYNLPTTTGSAEAMCKKVRWLLQKQRPTSPEKVLRVCRLLMKLHPTVRCRSWRSRKSHQVFRS